MNICAVQVYIW